MDSDAPGFAEWTDALASGETHLAFEEWEKLNERAVKRAKRRIKAAKKREKARKAAEKEEITYEPAPQFEVGGYRGPPLFSGIKMGYGTRDDPDLDAFQGLSRDP